jgi:hypothetical protein
MRLRLILPLILAIFFNSPHSYAQLQVLPNAFNGWQSGKHDPVVMWPRSDAAAKMDSHPEQTQALIEGGLVSIEEHYYSKGTKELAVRSFRAKDPSGAYQIYTTRLRAGMTASHLGNVSASGPDGSAILLGNFVIGATKDASTEDLSALLTILKPQVDDAPGPPIPGYLPTPGRTPGTERYALGPVGFQEAAKALDRPEAAGLAELVGFKSGAEAMFARYRNGKDDATLLLIDYPTPQLAEVHLKHMERALAAAKNGDSVERKGSLLSIVLAPTSQEYAKKLRNAVNYETQVTWNEASTTATDPPITSTLVKIIIATGVFMMVTIVVGIAFGGVRIITKRLFPGKVFDRKDQIEVLQLGLSSKPIDPSDMY